MADIIIDKKIAPAEATRGQWAKVDMSTMSLNYPASGRGKYAQLNYIIGSEPGSLNLALSGGTVILPVSTVNINEPVSVENVAGDTLAVTISSSIPISAVFTGQSQVILVSAADTIPVEQVLPTTTAKFASSYDTGVLYHITFPTTKLIEVANAGLTGDNSITIAYVYFGSSASPGDPTADGLPLRGRENQPGYYSIEYAASSVYIEVDTNATNVRVLTHS